MTLLRPPQTPQNQGGGWVDFACLTPAQHPLKKPEKFVRIGLPIPRLLLVIRSELLFSLVGSENRPLLIKNLAAPTAATRQ
ncbi:hypothetical protein M595_1480 [Lyngbya aestuarii BL J]|uniref:Uncharacterized protein n=1 Tax=Lyngbya aestuarii BL J TaxID=1348334 RepID=U7QMQ6_9CYAN|nr:hypothetical protein M595_1480 [Lyngbya aestuarii BL J]